VSRPRRRASIPTRSSNISAAVTLSMTSARRSICVRCSRVRPPTGGRVWSCRSRSRNWSGIGKTRSMHSMTSPMERSSSGPAPSRPKTHCNWHRGFLPPRSAS
jgi:hypothetical protein